MKNSSIGIKSIFMVVLVLTFLIPINIFAQSPFYIAFKPGIYSPQSSDLDGFDTGFSGEFVFGFRFHPNIAAELGIGYFNTEGEKTVVGATYVGRKNFDIDVWPFTFTLKAILPYKKWEFFALAGGAVYSVSRPYDVEDYDYHYYYCCHYDYEYDLILGGYWGAGIHYNIAPKIFVGVEGKYLWTEQAKFEDLEEKFKLDGIIATAVIGIRF
jgi:opacity protein-like surface antigen